MYEGLLDRESLRAEDRVNYFNNTLRRHFKGALSVFLRRLFQFIRAKRENMEMVKWIGKLSLLYERLQYSRMDMLPTNNMSETL